MSPHLGYLIESSNMSSYSTFSIWYLNGHFYTVDTKHPKWTNKHKKFTEDSQKFCSTETKWGYPKKGLQRGDFLIVIEIKETCVCKCRLTGIQKSK